MRFVCLVACFAPLPLSAFPEIGFLQFKVEHNLETSDCLATGSCFFQFEERDDLAPWLNEIESASNLAVLHWDQGIPWLAFDLNLPSGQDRIAYYDARLDPATVAWLDTFSAHFASLGRGYLAVSLLNGERNGLAPVYLDPTARVEIPDLCPSLSPGTQVVVNPGTGPVSFDIERSYLNFLRYLIAKLSPNYVGLVVEANLLETKCPGQASGLYALYRNLYDVLEAELDPKPYLFATLSLPPLLDYARSACFPTSSFLPCSFPPAGPAPSAGPAACFPKSLGAIAELNLGGRLDVLALSLYPDGFEMNPASDGSISSEAFLLADWNGGGACSARLTWPSVEDPLAAIETLGWTGPIAFAETSDRSCPSPLRFDLPNPGGAPDPLEYVFSLPGSPALQAEWTSRTLRTAIENDYLFYAHAFLRDYPPVGPWVVDQGVFPIAGAQLVNTWPCSGIQDAAGALKPEMAAIGLPEPSGLCLIASGVVALAGIGRRRLSLPLRASPQPQLLRGASRF
ncbi:MAG: hypothetical protein AB8G23_04895 [Myxococcota bacterium]